MEFYYENKAKISGTVVNDFKFNHSFKEKKYYKAYLEVSRKSGVKDVLPVVAEDTLIDRNISYLGKKLTVTGKLYTYSKNHYLYIYVGAETLTEDILDADANNEIYLEGAICKEPNYRITPLSNRHITDFMIAVNRPNDKVDYIPCVCWGRNAKLVKLLDVGTNVILSGRFQSRPYKKNVDGKEMQKTAYEFSVSVTEVIG